MLDDLRKAQSQVSNDFFPFNVIVSGLMERLQRSFKEVFEKVAIVNMMHKSR